MANSLSPLTKDQLKRYFVSGVSLSGVRQKDGSIKCSMKLDHFLEEWPNEIECGPNTYTLENVQKFNNGFEQADYC